MGSARQDPVAGRVEYRRLDRRVGQPAQACGDLLNAGLPVRERAQPQAQQPADLVHSRTAELHHVVEASPQRRV